jgi:hypothetical protein
MPIVEFHNSRKALLVLVIEPSGEEHEIPYRSSAAIRYALHEGAEDRSFCDCAEGRVSFWCNAESYEVEVLHPSATDNLIWDICVNGGWCGGIVDGKPTRVTDLIPKKGEVTAREFARLAVRADGWPDAEPMPDKHLRWLETKFIEHFGAEVVPCEDLHRISPRPFDGA